MYFQYETRRLLLRILDEGDAAAVLDFYKSGDAYFGKMEPERCGNFFTEHYQSCQLQYEADGFIAERSARYYMFIKTAPDKIIGTVALRNMVKGNFYSCTIGYKMGPQYIGMGLCTEAVDCITRAAFRDSGMHRIVAYVQPDNIASIKVLEHCGYGFEGVARDYVRPGGKWHDHAIYSKIGM